ncbi:hypothetical protein [Lentzea atacamensis]|uniref:hypothetical protein n=1 Tax=Lentzea atacamensis TaxID=531938 RepID=UPI00147650D3|nr:hypothetical protein [Lentzea atacamensis]
MARVSSLLTHPREDELSPEVMVSNLFRCALLGIEHEGQRFVGPIPRAQRSCCLQRVSNLAFDRQARRVDLRAKVDGDLNIT